MKKTLAVLATVATVGATVVTAPAPAEARGIGPGLAFGLAAGALAAGAAASAYPYYGPGYGYYDYGPRYYRPAYYGYGVGPYAYYGGPGKSPEHASGLFCCCKDPRYDQNGTRFSPLRAFSSVVTKYSSRSRLNFSCVALKFATRFAISSRSFASRSCCSVMPTP